MKTSLPLGVIAAALFVGAAWAGVLGAIHLAGAASPIDRLETTLLDARIGWVGRRPPPDDVAIVVIDDPTVTAVGRYPLDRGTLADIVDRIRLSGARALAIDMLLVGETDPEADAALADALARFPAVIAAAAQFEIGEGAAGAVPAPGDTLTPLSKLAAAANTALVNVAADAGGTPRHVPMVFDTSSGPMPSIVLRAYGLYTGEMPPLTASGLRLGPGELPLDIGWHLPLNYYGPGKTITTISALDILRGPAPVEGLSGKLVMLGVTATGVGDRFTTPFDPILPGVEVLATGVANLLDGSSLRRNETIRQIDVTAAVVITLAGMAAVAFLPLAVGSAVAAILLFAWLAVISMAFSHVFWLNGALPIIASVPAVAALTVLRQVFDRRSMRRMAMAQDALGRFQSAKISRRIADDPGFLLEPREQQAAILFIDLAGYTGLSERIGARSTRDLLKSFHTIVVEEAERRNGLVMDFMGDGVMVGFGIPDGNPGDAANAVAAAFTMLGAVRHRLVTDDVVGGIEAVRVGVHYGAVVLSRLGHEGHQQIATTGDCVNVASRLLDIARSREAAVAFSADVVRAAVSGGLILSPQPPLETIAIRGRRQPVEVALWSVAEAERQAERLVL
ncbi:adenylate/guanylate cyclase domain-containing protein [Ciceribacter sp. L1K23]|uniref:CHASE2 domain-containing protein n=1 Tax=Ciceribacter sp. L1K23 TaxID=2820276 RepID=UPI001B80EFC9|nr:adenylate/guanylate cyclase domain-containing protein [Ciceribacter sp. L1K23]MBR0558308.1 adenylate/guanylate cyclase domain-containing protein [Ciceribacter sp. L1K23]